MLVKDAQGNVQPIECFAQIAQQFNCLLFSLLTLLAEFQIGKTEFFTQFFLLLFQAGKLRSNSKQFLFHLHLPGDVVQHLVHLLLRPKRPAHTCFNKF